MKNGEEISDTLEKGKAHIKEAAEVVAETVRSTGRKLRDTGRAAGEELSDLGAEAARCSKDLFAQCQEQIRNHPVAAFGIAFAAGVVIARLLRR